MVWLARWPGTGAFFGYAALAFVFFGLPGAAHPSSECICYPGSPDPQQFMWALVWWPHALAHGLDPIHSHALFAPEGVTLASGQLIPAASVVLAPITAAAGPVAAYNLLGVLAPTLAAFTAFLLCRRITRKWLPSLVGGYLFGFSSYLLGQLFGHPHLTLVFLLPVMVHIVLRRLDGELGTGRFVAELDESGAYLGLPLILILVRLAVADWRRLAVRYLVGLLVLLGIATLGARLQIAGHSTIPMPWAAFDQLPALEAALPARFAVYIALVAAVAASLWLAWSRESVAWRWALGALAVAATLPNLAADYWHGPARIPRYFTDGAWRADLRSNDVALLLPFGFRGNGMAWQAQTRIGFRQAGGGIGGALSPPPPPPPPRRAPPPAARPPPAPAPPRRAL